jgi:Mrp family chromosome partitioning ATPase
LASHKFKEFLSLACQKFDYVIIDTPPVAMLTDTYLIARAVDGAVVVVESGKTSKRMLGRIAKNIKDKKTRILGAFFNKVSITNKNHYGYAYYQQYEKQQRQQ